MTADARQLFTERYATYMRFIRAMRYPHGLRAFFLASGLLGRPGLRVLEAGCGTGALTLAVHEAALRRGMPLGSLDAFDLTPAMLSRLRRERFVDALAGLRERLRDGGRLVLFITRRNPLMRLMIGRWWQANLYTAAELREAFQRAGFARTRFPGFPPVARYLAAWGHVVEAAR